MPDRATLHAHDHKGRRLSRPVRKITIGTRITLEEKRRLFVDGEQYEPHSKPRLRSECVDGARPCPFVSCRYHLFLDVTRNGGLTLNYPDLEPDQLLESCCLDVADRGGATLEIVGEVLNLTRERARQLEEILLERLRKSEAFRELFEEATNG
ncbi:MAG TPA: sigma factor-like helix-turn-helix DNA-binding protein [Steroidobacteraceae bacterium]|jgi:hypothetical protein|nr:sigma factor-like helix-turn-helix DNA-binding protein [Steroidobacteraceae bacterium]